jgi:hypothetical protein
MEPGQRIQGFANLGRILSLSIPAVTGGAGGFLKRVQPPVTMAKQKEVFIGNREQRAFQRREDALLIVGPFDCGNPPLVAEFPDRAPVVLSRISADDPLPNLRDGGTHTPERAGRRRRRRFYQRCIIIINVTRDCQGKRTSCVKPEGGTDRLETASLFERRSHAG